jgi:hypothetical protein
MQLDRGTAAAAGKGFKAAAAARGKPVPSPPSDDDEDEGGSSEEPVPMGQVDVSSGDIDEDQVEKIFGDDEAQKAVEPKAAAAGGEQKQAQRRQQQGRKPGAAAAAAAAGKAGTNGLPAARGAAAAAAAGRGPADAAAAAAAGASKVKKKKQFDALSLYDGFQVGGMEQAHGRNIKPACADPHVAGQRCSTEPYVHSKCSMCNCRQGCLVTGHVHVGRQRFIQWRLCCSLYYLAVLLPPDAL